MHRLPRARRQKRLFLRYSDNTFATLFTHTNGIFSGTSAPTQAPPLFIYFYSLHPHTHQTVTSMPRRVPNRDTVKTFHPDSVRSAPPAAKRQTDLLWGGGVCVLSGTASTFTKVGACVVMEGLFIFLNQLYTFPDLIPPEMTWLNGSCTVTLLHLALISQVFVCYLCFWALKSCDHLKTTYSQLQHSCLFFFLSIAVQWPSFHLCFCVFYCSEGDLFGRLLCYKCFISNVLLISTSFLFEVYETSQEGFQNNASDNRTSVKQMQRNDECKKKRVEITDFLIFLMQLNSRSHYVSLLLSKLPSLF